MGSIHNVLIFHGSYGVKPPYIPILLNTATFSACLYALNNEVNLQHMNHEYKLNNSNGVSCFSYSRFALRKFNQPSSLCDFFYLLTQVRRI